MPRKNRTRPLQLTADQNMIDGLTKNAAAIGGFLIGGKTFTVAQAIALVQTALTASKTVVIQHTALEASLQEETALRTDNKAFFDGLIQSMQTMFAGQVSTLGDFGLKAPKKAVVSPEMRVAAAAKAKATREARAPKAVTGSSRG